MRGKRKMKKVFTSAVVCLLSLCLTVPVSAGWVCDPPGIDPLPAKVTMFPYPVLHGAWVDVEVGSSTYHRRWTEGTTYLTYAEPLYAWQSQRAFKTYLDVLPLSSGRIKASNIIILSYPSNTVANTVGDTVWFSRLLTGVGTQGYTYTAVQPILSPYGLRMSNSYSGAPLQNQIPFWAAQFSAQMNYAHDDCTTVVPLRVHFYIFHQ
jgi:hypothetical protein